MLKNFIKNTTFLFTTISILFFSFAPKTINLFFERGLAEKIANSGNNDNFLAMHKSLPTGSKVMVRNTANGRTVVVKIIGQMPNIGSNDKLVIKISQNAYHRLLAQGKRFGVELTQAPNDADVADRPEDSPENEALKNKKEEKLTEKSEEKLKNKGNKSLKKIDEEKTGEKINEIDGKNAITYKVKVSDNLYKIAKKYNTSVKELKKLNNLKDFSLYEGQILKLK